jgi:glycosyltransferase involved in cell wall biosynthesis
MNPEKDKPQVLFIGRYSASEQLSGPEKYAKRIAQQYATANGNVTFIQYFFDGTKYGFFKKLFGKETVIAEGSVELVTAGLFRLIGAVRKVKPGIIHIITFERFAAIALIYKIFGKAKVIYNSHGVIAYENTAIKKCSSFYRLKDKIAEWMLFRYADKIIFPSENTMDIAEGYFELNERRCMILPGGIDDEFKKENKRETESGAALNCVVMNTSEYSKSGMDFLQKIIDNCSNNMNLYLIGKKYEVSSANPAFKITSVDKMNAAELSAFYANKHVFLSLNSYETFSLAAIEAMSCGMIPIVTSNTGMSRYILHGENGYIIEYGKTEQIMSILNELANNSNLRAAISSRATEIYQILNWKEVFGTYEHVYEELSD